MAGSIFRVMDLQPSLRTMSRMMFCTPHSCTAILMGHVRGVILAAAARRGIEVSSYAATRVKKYVTGRGRASKPQMQRAIQQMLGLVDLPEPDDVADALAIALCCGSERSRQGLAGMTR